MRVLVCSERSLVGPPGGGRLLLRALLRELVHRHEIRLICLEPMDASEMWMQAVSVRVVAGRGRRGNPSRWTRDHPGDSNWWSPTGLYPGRVGRVARAVANGRPMYVDQLARRLQPTLVDELQAFRPDLVHVAGGGLAALGRSLEAVPSVVVPQDAEYKNVESQALEYAGLRRRLLLGEAKRMLGFEGKEYSRFTRVVVQSYEDRQALQSANPHMAVAVIPNGVDTAFFAPPTFRERSSTIVFHGIMSYAPNVLAADILARKVLPLVQQRHPEARLAIVGRAPDPKIRALERIAGVTVTGEVEDVRSWLKTGRVYVFAKFTGTGIANKLLEAMACGMPCVATPLALRGISPTPGRDILVARGAREIAEQVQRLLDDDALAGSLGEAARRYAETNHDWRRAGRAYERVYESAVQAHAESTA